MSRSSRQLLATLALLRLIAAPVLAEQRQADEALAFVAVPGGAPLPPVAVAVRLEPYERRSGQPRPSPSRSVGPRPRYVRPIVTLPPNPVRVVQVGAVGGSGGHAGTVTGRASWYCGHGSRCTSGHPGGLYAAAGPELRVGDWRGRRVLVSAGGRSVVVRLIDCNCGPDANLIDLYSDAFRQLAPLSQGVVKVTVSW